MDIGILIVSGIIFIIAVILYWHVYKRKEEITSKVVEDWREELYKEVDDIRQEKDKLLDSYYTIIQRLEDTIEFDQTRAKEAHESTEALLAAERERARAELGGIKALEEERIKHDAAALESGLKAKYQQMEFQLISDFETTRGGFNVELEKIRQELEEFRAKRAAINEANRLEQEAQNEVEFHRIHLTETDKEDIHYLLSIKDKISNHEILPKLIWSEYLQKPFNQMLKNVVGNTSPKNVIYCIENISTHKKYIGKTKQEISKRWSDHIKTSLKDRESNLLYKNLFNHWDEFTFLILEEVENSDLLGEREKFYINFYQSNIYGYNMINGG